MEPAGRVFVEEIQLMTNIEIVARCFNGTNLEASSSMDKYS